MVTVRVAMKYYRAKMADSCEVLLYMVNVSVRGRNRCFTLRSPNMNLTH